MFWPIEVCCLCIFILPECFAPRTLLNLLLIISFRLLCSFFCACHFCQSEHSGMNWSYFSTLHKCTIGANTATISATRHIHAIQVLKADCCLYRGADKSLAQLDLKIQLKSRYSSSDAEVIAVPDTWLDGQGSELFLQLACKSQSLVAVTCFLPGRTKDLSAPRVHAMGQVPMKRYWPSCPVKCG